MRDIATANIADQKEENHVQNRERKEHPEINSKEMVAVDWIIAVLNKTLELVFSILFLHFKIKLSVTLYFARHVLRVVRSYSE